MKRLLCVAAACALLAPATAQAVPVANGNFERGDLKGWKTLFEPNACGLWEVYSGEYIEPGLRIAPPPQGQYGALAIQPSCPSRMVISQTVKLPKRQRHVLRFKLAYQNTANGFKTPNTLSVEGPDNQQFRADVLTARAPLLSLKKKHVLASVFRTNRGTRKKRGYKTVKANLSRFAGRKVQLRFAVAVNLSPLVVGLDKVRIASKRKR